MQRQGLDRLAHVHAMIVGVLSLGFTSGSGASPAVLPSVLPLGLVGAGLHQFQFEEVPVPSNGSGKAPASPLETGFVRRTIVTIKPPSPPPPHILLPAFCVIEVCCMGVGSPSSPAWHCFTKCTQYLPDGTTKVTACGARPSGLFDNDLALKYPSVPGYPNSIPDCPGWGIFDGAWGPIDTYCGPYRRGHPDWPGDDWPLGSVTCSEASCGTDCSTCACIEDVMCRIEKCCVRYELFPELYGYNSNSSAFTALVECGCSPGLPSGSPPLGAPGWNVPIQVSDCPTCP